MRSSSKSKLSQEARVKIRMLELGYDRNDLAYILDVSPEYISYLINGKRHSRYFQDKIADILKKAPEELFDGR